MVRNSGQEENDQGIAYNDEKVEERRMEEQTKSGGPERHGQSMAWRGSTGRRSPGL